MLKTTHDFKKLKLHTYTFEHKNSYWDKTYLKEYDIWWEGIFDWRWKWIKGHNPSWCKFALVRIIFACRGDEITMGAWPSHMSMGLMDTIENIAQIGGEIACKTLVDHDIEMGRTAIVKILPPKFIKQNGSGVPPRKSKNYFTSCVLKFIKSG